MENITEILYSTHLCRRFWSVVVGDVVFDDGRRGLAGGPVVSHRISLRGVVVLGGVQVWRDLRPPARDRHVLVRRAEVALPLRLHVWGVAEVTSHLIRAALLALAVAVAAEAPADHEEHEGAQDGDDDLVGDGFSVAGRLVRFFELQHRHTAQDRAAK